DGGLRDPRLLGNFRCRYATLANTHQQRDNRYYQAPVKAQVMLAKGSTVQATIEFLVHAAGPEAVRTTLDALPAEQRARLAGVSARDEVPYADLVSLWQAADSLLAASDPGWMERQGAYA